MTEEPPYLSLGYGAEKAFSVTMALGYDHSHRAVSPIISLGNLPR